MRIQLLVPIVLTAAVLSGCHQAPPKQAELGQVLPNIPLPPEPEPLIRQTGTNAIQFTIVSRVGPDSVVSYYRHVLSSDPFHLVNERQSGKTVAFYAEQDGPSIWVTVSPNGSEGSMIIIAGASDTTKIKH